MFPIRCLHFQTGTSVCPECQTVLLAYFDTDEFVPVWMYDEACKDDQDKYITREGRRYYRYRVFHTGTGVMGIELKPDKHNRVNYSNVNHRYRGYGFGEK